MTWFIDTVQSGVSRILRRCTVPRDLRGYIVAIRATLNLQAYVLKLEIILCEVRSALSFWTKIRCFLLVWDYERMAKEMTKTKEIFKKTLATQIEARCSHLTSESSAVVQQGFVPM